MKSYFLPEENLVQCVDAIMSVYPVIGPVANRGRFVFDQLDSADELRLDYDTTILPPKKVFFPAKQDLVRFEKDNIEGCIDPVPKVLFGVHPHDIRAIAMSDRFYSDGHVDNNYMANREATIIVGSSVQNAYKHAFFGSINAGMPVEGHDLFLTRIDGGYLVEVITDKGQELVDLVKLTEASDQQISPVSQIARDTESSCPESLAGSEEEIREKVRASFDSDLWDELSEDCFSCGSCNIVCPTCYCFDVQDQWAVSGDCGSRFRTWDACLTGEFSEVSVQGGSENFRETKASRFRHRFMRKAAYLNDQLGGPACVGCGRCSGACTADIANPVTVINKVMEQ